MDKLITKAERRRLAQGSYEDHIRSVKFLIGEAELISTFKDHAVVRKDGEFYKVMIGRGDNGVLRLSGESKLEVKQYDVAQSGELTKDLALEVVDQFFRGSIDWPLARLMEIAEHTDPCSECAAVDVVQSMIASPRLWKRLMKERESGIKRIIAGKLESLRKSKLQAKFEWLYAEGASISGEDMTEVSSEVSRDLDETIKRLNMLEASVCKAAEAVASNEKTVQDDEDGQILARVNEFATDLLTDLRMLQEKVSGIEIRDLACVARLRDVLAEGLNFYGIASCFVSAVADRLS